MATLEESTISNERETNVVNESITKALVNNIIQAVADAPVTAGETGFETIEALFRALASYIAVRAEGRTSAEADDFWLIAKLCGRHGAF
jgi:hypothetical protein